MSVAENVELVMLFVSSIVPPTNGSEIDVAVAHVSVDVMSTPGMTLPGTFPTPVRSTDFTSVVPLDGGSMAAPPFSGGDVPRFGSGLVKSMPQKRPICPCPQALLGLGGTNVVNSQEPLNTAMGPVTIS